MILTETPLQFHRSRQFLVQIIMKGAITSFYQEFLINFPSSTYQKTDNFNISISTNHWEQNYLGFDQSLNIKLTDCLVLLSIFQFVYIMSGTSIGIWTRVVDRFFQSSLLCWLLPRVTWKLVWVQLSWWHQCMEKIY